MSLGTLFIIAAPSGAGKTSLVKALASNMPRLHVSVSHTTRKKRPGEVDGDDYFFVEPRQFQKMIEEQAFLEYAEVFGSLYGTAHETVKNTLHGGHDMILEIDWQGAQQVRQKMPSASSIFIFPPSLQELEARLTDRRQDSEETIRRRMSDALSEISHYTEFDFLIVNDDFDRAFEQLKSIILASRLKRENQDLKLRDTINDLLGRKRDNISRV